jgi:hypothetical protein
MRGRLDVVERDGVCDVTGCENWPHMVYARVCRGMCKMIGRSLLEIFVKGGTVSRLCRSELATVGK